MPTILWAGKTARGGFLFVLPGRTPTKGNSRVSRREMKPSKAYLTWMVETAYSAIALANMVRRAGVRLPIGSRTLVSLNIYLPNLVRGDADNYHKAVGDWLQTNAFIANDRLIHWGPTKLYLDRADPRLELVAEPYIAGEGEL
jgi:Holliday junction resolvase RusA-like endonuclease